MNPYDTELNDLSENDKLIVALPTPLMRHEPPPMNEQHLPFSIVMLSSEDILISVLTEFDKLSF